MDSLELEIAILKILLVICSIVILFMIYYNVVLYRRHRTLKNQVRQAEHDAESRGIS